MYSQTKRNILDINSGRHRQSAHNSVTTSFSAQTSVTSSDLTQTYTNNHPVV